MTRTVLQYQSDIDVNGSSALLTAANGDPFPLHGDRGHFYLTIRHWYQVVPAVGERGPYKVASTSYYYEMDDEDSQEVMSYHWHPFSRSEEVRPHLHLGSSLGVVATRLLGGHVPTGRIAFEDVLRLLITEFRIHPARSDWSSVLDETQAAFEKWRSWPSGVPVPEDTGQ